MAGVAGDRRDGVSFLQRRGGPDADEPAVVASGAADDRSERGGEPAARGGRDLGAGAVRPGAAGGRVGAAAAAARATTARAGGGGGLPGREPGGGGVGALPRVRDQPGVVTRAR